MQVMEKIPLVLDLASFNFTEREVIETEDSHQRHCNTLFISLRDAYQWLKLGS